MFLYSQNAKQVAAIEASLAWIVEHSEQGDTQAEPILVLAVSPLSQIRFFVLSFSIRSNFVSALLSSFDITYLITVRFDHFQ